MNYKFILVISASVLIAGCVGVGGLGSANKTNELRPGMSIEEVKQIFGSPKQTEFIADKLVWKYSLQQPWVGWVLYYLVFDSNTQKLNSWYANEEEYYRNQQLWIDSMKGTALMPYQINQNIQHSGQIDTHVSGSIDVRQR